MEKINKEWVRHYLDVFKKKYPNYVAYDKFITEKIIEFKESFLNLNKNNVILLLCCIDSFWSTHSGKHIITIAETIIQNSKQFYKDVFIQPTYNIVDVLLKPTIKNDTSRGAISLISKLCCKCNEKFFPIIDSQIRKFLIEQNKTSENHFVNEEITDYRLSHNYEFFVQIIDSFAEHFKLEQFKYRQLDLAIWTKQKIENKKK